MAAELGQTTDPRALVPGDAAAIVGAMWAMRSYGDLLSEAGGGLARIDTQDGWRGNAAEQFRGRFHGQPRAWLVAGDSFHEAASALDSYASTLGWAQQRAADAIRMWADATAATRDAQAQHQQAVADAARQAAARAASGLPSAVADIPFHDPGEAQREAARHLLADARGQLQRAGDDAERTVGAARDNAPARPGFWSKVGHALSDVGHGLEDAGGRLVNGLASFGNAAIHHPGDTLAAAGGIALATAGAAGDTLGVALDATGVGAIAGVPLNAVSTAGVVAGAGITAAAVGDLAQHAAIDDQASPVDTGGDPPQQAPGRVGTKTDRLKEHLTEKDLDAARRELDGEVVARKPDGQPWDHVDEVRNAQRGLVNRVNQLKRQLGDSRISAADRATVEAELSEASRLLDHSEQYVPRG